MAHQAYAQYIKEMGYPPKEIKHLMNFAKTKGLTVSYKDAKNAVKSDPKMNTQTTAARVKPKRIQPKTNDDQKSTDSKSTETIWQTYINKTGNPPKTAFQLMMFSRMHDDVQNINVAQAKRVFDAMAKQQVSRPKRSTSVSKENYSYQISVRYVGKVYFISLTQSMEEYTVADLRKDVIQKYISEPATSLIFKLDSKVIHQYSMNIISYLKQHKKREATFDVECIDRSHAVLKTPKTVLQTEIESHGTNVKKLIESLKHSFGEAYFTEESEAKKEDCAHLGNWDPNLNEAVSNVVTGQQNKMFDDILKEFEQKIERKLHDHDGLTSKVQSSTDIPTIKQQLDAMIHERRRKIDEKYVTKLQEIEDMHRLSNAAWEKIQQESLTNSNNDAAVKQKIEMQRMKRIEYQQRIIANGQREYSREQEKNEELHSEQTKELLNSNNIEKWHNTFKAEDVQREKVQTVKEMVRNKIQTTNAQIKFAKYLHNSPFANNLREDAKTLDHEITKIATLAGEPVLIDMVDRNITEEQDAHDDGKEEQYLEFELRFDDDYSNWSVEKQADIKRNLAVTIGVDAQNLEFISSRNGCIIARFKAKVKAIYEKAKAFGKEVKKQVKEFAGKVFVGHKWASKVDECVPFLEAKLGAVKANKDAVYLASKCVAVIVSHFTSDKNKNILDSDFLSDDADKQAHKIIMNPQWDKEYGPGQTHWEGAIADGEDRGGYPYYCPNGWKRYGIRVANFNEKYRGWSVCYHGSETYYMGSIMSHGIFGTGNTTQRYFSPSIEYSAWPRYAMPKKLKNGKYIQTIFQCRINSDPTIMRKGGSTSGYADGSVIIDPNFDKNTQMTGMEWYLEEPNLDQYVVYGIMVRECDDPSKLPSSHWWRMNLDQWKQYYPIMDQ